MYEKADGKIVRRKAMNSEKDLEQVLVRFCETQKLAVLATENGRQPYCNLVAVTPFRDLKQVLFATPRSTTKYKNLTKNARVSLLFDNRSNTESDFDNAVAVTVLGIAAEIKDAAQLDMKRHHISRHGHIKSFIESADCALFSVAVKRYIIVDHFQKVSVLDMEG